MRIKFLIGLLCAFMLNAFAQQQDSLLKSQPLTYCEQMPEYPGGTSAMMKHLLKNVSVSKVAIDSGFIGAIHVKFVVDEKGRTGNVQFPDFKNTRRQHNKDVEKQIASAILSMPAFTPGKQDGKDVAVWMQLPVRLCPIK